MRGMEIASAVGSADVAVGLTFDEQDVSTMLKIDNAKKSFLFKVLLLIRLSPEDRLECNTGKESNNRRPDRSLT